MKNEIEFYKEYISEFEIGDTKNKDHCTASEIFGFLEKTVAPIKKDLNASLILAKSVTCHFLHKTKPFGKMTIKCTVNLNAILFSVFQNEVMTAEGSYEIAKIVE